MKPTQDIRISENNVKDMICCPGGVEVRGKGLKGDLEKTVHWRERMLEEGMTGFISYLNGEARGFVEYMPVENAPFPILWDGEEIAVLMCYHWKGDEDEHLEREKDLIEMAVEDARKRFVGMITLGWDHPVHFPIELLKDIGFQEVERDEYLSLTWMPFEDGLDEPSFKETRFRPTDLSSQGKLSIQLGFSHRCPYSIHHSVKVEEVVSKIKDDRIVFEQYEIDTRKDAVEHSKENWNWDWLFLNGEEVELFEKTSEELKETIEKRLEELG